MAGRRLERQVHRGHRDGRLHRPHRRTTTWLAAGAVLLLVSVGLSANPAVTGAASGPVESGSSDWRQISAGRFHTCGLRTTGRLYCWGQDDAGQLGDGGTNTNQVTPTEVAGGATNWSAVSVGRLHTCARRTTGRLYCWGDDDTGQLGDGGADTAQPAPVLVAGGATNWANVTAGGSHSCARRTTGRLYCWGSDFDGQLGNGGTNTDQATPTQVAGNTTDWTTVAVGGAHTCARKTTGRLYCWGLDSSGQVGNGAPTGSQPAPVLVAGGATTWTTVSAGGLHTCAGRSNGRLFCWGDDTSGQVGDGGTNTNRPAPTQVAGGATDWATVAAGSSHSCARKTTGRLYCWGLDGAGQVGDGGTNTDRPIPTEVAGGATDWAAATSGGAHTCARITSGRIFCWGLDGSGQLGNGATSANRPTPDQVVV